MPPNVSYLYFVERPRGIKVGRGRLWLKTTFVQLECAKGGERLDNGEQNGKGEGCAAPGGITLDVAFMTRELEYADGGAKAG